MHKQQFVKISEVGVSPVPRYHQINIVISIWIMGRVGAPDVFWV